MTDDCPNCGAPYSERVVVEIGDQYADVFGKTPRGLFSDFVRICPDPEAARRASQEPNADLDVYLHRFRDLTGGVGIAD